MKSLRQSNIVYPRKAWRTVTDPVLGIYVPLIVRPNPYSHLKLLNGSSRYYPSLRLLLVQLTMEAPLVVLALKPYMPCSGT